jgi:hypothetical protein
MLAAQGRRIRIEPQEPGLPERALFRGLTRAVTSDESVTMKTMTRRQLSREPSRLDKIRPGESVAVPDSKGGLIVTRPKKKRLSADELFAEVERMGAGCPPVDTLKILQEGED